MKYLTTCVAVILGAGLLFAGAGPKGAPSAAPATRPKDKARTPSEAVAAFYRVLVQEGPPTREQEKDLFGDSGGLKTHLIDKNGGSADRPALLELYRRNRDLFLPRNMKDPKSLGGVRISSMFTFMGSPDQFAGGSPPRDRDNHGGYVLALFVNDVQAKPPHFRSVVFSVWDNGELGGDDMYFGGFDGQMSYEKFFDTKWWTEHHGKEVCP
jgi:hypothetical protein